MDIKLLIILISPVLASGSISLPVIYVEGTHYEVAREVASTFKERIVNFYRRNDDLKKVLIPFVATKFGKRVYDDYVTTVNATYPQYLDEMRGISDATGITFKSVFLMHMAVEIIAFKRLQQADDCSDVHVNNRDLTLIAHNEDAHPLIKDYGYVVSAKIRNVHRRGLLTIPEEKYTAYSYPGYLQGNSFGFTESGLVITVNALYPKYPKYGRKIPRFVLNRAMLSAQNQADLETILASNNFGVSFGCSVNVVDISTKPVTTTYNYELAPTTEPKTLINKITITNGTRISSSHYGYYFHFNMYDHTNIVQYPAATISSVHRKARALQLPIPRTARGALVILGDDEDVKYPIFRTPRPTDPGATVATGVFDVTNCKMLIYKDNPKLSKGPLVQLDLPCKK